MLGVPLLKQRFPMQHKIGARYWSVDKQGRLGAPIQGGSFWAPGLNKPKCFNASCNFSENCTCGLYAFHYERGLDQTGYFNIATGKITSSLGVGAGLIGGIAYWNPSESYKNATAGDIIRAKFAAVACLTQVKGASRANKKETKRSAEYYGVEIVRPEEIQDAVDAFVEAGIGQFYDPPLAPLSSLIGRTVSPPAEHFDFVPRTRRPRPMGRIS